MNKAVNNLIIDFESPEPAGGGDQAELFLTSFSEMQCQEAIEATTALADRSFAHALVKTAPTAADDKSDPFAYTTTSRYTSDRFYSVIVGIVVGSDGIVSIVGSVGIFGVVGILGVVGIVSVVGVNA
jgi:hypothetical protein